VWDPHVTAPLSLADLFLPILEIIASRLSKIARGAVSAHIEGQSIHLISRWRRGARRGEFKNAFFVNALPEPDLR